MERITVQNLIQTAEGENVVMGEFAPPDDVVTWRTTILETGEPGVVFGLSNVRDQEVVTVFTAEQARTVGLDLMLAGATDEGMARLARDVLRGRLS